MVLGWYLCDNLFLLGRVYWEMDMVTTSRGSLQINPSEFVFKARGCQIFIQTTACEADFIHPKQCLQQWMYSTIQCVEPNRSTSKFEKILCTLIFDLCGAHTGNYVIFGMKYVLHSLGSLQCVFFLSRNTPTSVGPSLTLLPKKNIDSLWTPLQKGIIFTSQLKLRQII